MTLLDYTIDGKHVEYPVADSQMKKFLRKQLTNEEIAELYALIKYNRDEKLKDTIEFKNSLKSYLQISFIRLRIVIWEFTQMKIWEMKMVQQYLI